MFESGCFVNRRGASIDGVMRLTPLRFERGKQSLQNFFPALHAKLLSNAPEAIFGFWSHRNTKLGRPIGTAQAARIKGGIAYRTGRCLRRMACKKSRILTYRARQFASFHRSGGFGFELMNFGKIKGNSVFRHHAASFFG